MASPGASDVEACEDGCKRDVDGDSETRAKAQAKTTLLEPLNGPLVKRRQLPHRLASSTRTAAVIEVRRVSIRILLSGQLSTRA